LGAGSGLGATATTPGQPNPFAAFPGLGGMGAGAGLGGAPPQDMNATMAMMQNPAMQSMMAGMLANPAFIDQVGACLGSCWLAFMIDWQILSAWRGGVSLSDLEEDWLVGIADDARMCVCVAMVCQMAASNPMLRQMLDTNPELRTMMGNPQFVQQVLNPDNMRAMMQLQRSGMLPGMMPGMNP
jgi:hypothetical protein